MNATEAGKRLLKHGADAVTMLRTLRRDPRVPSKVKWVLGGAVASVVSPIDFIPEAFLFVFGLADDAVMITWLAGAVLAETERFLEWEKQRDRVVVI